MRRQSLGQRPEAAALGSLFSTTFATGKGLAQAICDRDRLFLPQPCVLCEAVSFRTRTAVDCRRKTRS